MAASDVIQVTCSAPVNIAVVKYWGKRDEELILPVNSSLSATLHQDQLMTITSIAASKTFDKDRMWLNKKCVPLQVPQIFLTPEWRTFCQPPCVLVLCLFFLVSLFQLSFAILAHVSPFLLRHCPIHREESVDAVRLQNCLRELRKRASDKKNEKGMNIAHFITSTSG